MRWFQSHQRISEPDDFAYIVGRTSFIQFVPNEVAKIDMRPELIILKGTARQNF
jgi:hypothetical protein